MAAAWVNAAQELEQQPLAVQNATALLQGWMLPTAATLLKAVRAPPLAQAAALSALPIPPPTRLLARLRVGQSLGQGGQGGVYSCALAASPDDGAGVQGLALKVSQNRQCSGRRSSTQRKERRQQVQQMQQQMRLRAAITRSPVHSPSTRPPTPHPQCPHTIPAPPAAPPPQVTPVQMTKITSRCMRVPMHELLLAQLRRHLPTGEGRQFVADYQHAAVASMDAVAQVRFLSPVRESAISMRHSHHQLRDRPVPHHQAQKLGAAWLATIPQETIDAVLLVVMPKADGSLDDWPALKQQVLNAHHGDGPAANACLAQMTVSAALTVRPRRPGALAQLRVGRGSRVRHVPSVGSRTPFAVARFPLAPPRRRCAALRTCTRRCACSTAT